MLDISDIRIGNLYRHDKEWSYRNEGLKEFQFLWKNRDWYAVGECTLFLENIHPISVRPDTLEQLGMKEVHNNCWKLENGFWIWHNKEGDKQMPKGFYWGQDYFRVDYIHELQNLYRDLYKMEFTIKLPE